MIEPHRVTRFILLNRTVQKVVADQSVIKKIVSRRAGIYCARFSEIGSLNAFGTIFNASIGAAFVADEHCGCPAAFNVARTSPNWQY